jgi:hypothetical protein
MCGRDWQHKTPYVGDENSGLFGCASIWGDDYRTSKRRSCAISNCTMSIESTARNSELWVIACV